jgi:Membrane MotB of proton-channel complex MotA/MotB
VSERNPMSNDAASLMAAMPMPTETPQPPWLLSFCDFVSCLLACFVLLYSLVALDQSKLNQILEGVPGRQVAQDIPPSATPRGMEVAPEQDSRNADYLTSVMRAKLEQDPALAGIEVEGQGDRVLLHLPVKALLSGATPNAPAGERLVHALGGALNTLPNRVAVEVRPDRPAEFAAGLAHAVRLAQRLEGAGANPPIVARARLTAAGEATGIVLIVFDTAPLPAQAPVGAH